MPKNPKTTFGRDIRKRLDELNETHSWLVEQVKKDTGSGFDHSYLYKIMTGRNCNARKIKSICKILDLQPPGYMEETA